MKYLKSLSILLFFFGHCFSANTQNRLTIKREDVNEIRKIDWKNFDYESIKIIDSLVNRKSILILSEEDHGHGMSMDAKCMILKGLIDSSKINVLYLESSWINCDRIMDILKSKGVEGIEETVKFMRTYDLLYFVKIGFWEYLANKIISGDITLKGFDIAGISPIIGKELFEEAIKLETVKEYVARKGDKFKGVKWDFDFFNWNTASYYRKEAFVDMSDFIREVVKEYSVKMNYYRVRQWQSISNMFYWMSVRSDAFIGNKYGNQAKNEKQNSLFHSIRDSLMAAIFLEQYKNDTSKKIVCSMSTYHAIRNSSIIEGVENCCKENVVNIIGELINKKLPGKIYNICFITASGKYGIDDLGTGIGTKIKKPIKGSLEFALNKLNLPYCFIDLNSFKSNTSFYMKAVFNRYLKSDWKNNFSGVFFIKEMKPLVLLDWRQ